MSKGIRIQLKIKEIAGTTSEFGLPPEYDENGNEIILKDIQVVDVVPINPEPTKQYEEDLKFIKHIYGLDKESEDDN